MRFIHFFIIANLFLSVQNSWSQQECRVVFNQPLGPVVESVRKNIFIQAYHLLYGQGYMITRGPSKIPSFNQNSLEGQRIDDVDLKQVAMVLPQTNDKPFLGLTINTPTKISGKLYTIYGVFDDGDFLIFDSEKNPFKVSASEARKGTSQLSKFQHFEFGNQVTFRLDDQHPEHPATVLEEQGLSVKLLFWKQTNSANAPRQFEEKPTTLWVPFPFIITRQENPYPPLKPL
ncbi:MAG TPA: hypothetical protein PLJ21_04490 [Pseudobdellovibrionaceae bacterium]|nr:hypothetical protein [Pseudobdellovibrionaceae bacterium]